MLSENTQTHLLAHHKDFHEFAKKMVESALVRFDSIYWAFVHQYVSSPKKIIDLGCGPGSGLIFLKQHFEHANVTGVEGQPAMLEMSQAILEKHSEIKIIDHDLSRPFPTNYHHQYDLVTCTMVIHELPVPAVLVSEISKLLKPGGKAIIYDSIRIPLSEYTQGTFPDNLDLHQHFNEHCAFTVNDLIWLFSQKGLSHVESIIRHKGRHALMAFSNDMANGSQGNVVK